MNHRTNDSKTVADRVLILAVTGPGAVRDNSLNFEFVGVDQQSHQRLFIVGVASRIGFNDQSRPLVGRVQSACHRMDRGKPGQHGDKTDQNPIES